MLHLSQQTFAQQIMEFEWNFRLTGLASETFWHQNDCKIYMSANNYTDRQVYKTTELLYDLGKINSRTF